MSRPRPRRLTAPFVRNVEEPGVYGDGHGSGGLALHVRPHADGYGVRKVWTQRIAIDGKRTNIGLGQYPRVKLNEAREAAIANLRAVDRGEDPRRRRRTPAGATILAVVTVAEAIEAVIELRSDGWKDGGRSAGNWRRSFETYVLPTLGDRPVGAITAADLLSVLAPLAHSRPETCRKLRTRVGVVVRWAVAQGYRGDDPMPAVAAAMPRNGARQVKHHAALPHSEIATALSKIDASDASAATRLALRFVILTATRSGEVRNADWSEVDLGERIWTVPAARSKTNRPFRVPLSPQAVDVLEQAEAVRGANNLLFPNPATGRALSSEALSKLCREHDLGMTPHGARSSFRDWAGESGVAREVAEACLAHVAEATERAYARGDVLERRREVLERWGAYLGS